MASIRTLCLASCLVCLTGAISRAGDDARRYREHGQFSSEGAFRGFTVPGTAAKQHDRGIENWKKLYAKDTPVHVETDRFILFSSTDVKKLRDTGALLEKTYAVTTKVLEWEGETPWAGKLAVYIVGDPTELTSLIRIVERRRAAEDEQGSYEVDEEFPHLIAGPGPNKVSLAPEIHAGQQLAGALLMRKAGRSVPHWVQMGFGRASVLRAGPPAELLAEHRRVKALALKGKKGVKDILGPSSLDAEEVVILRASLMEYLAYSGRTAKFLPFVKGFQVTEMAPEPKIEQALDAANFTADKLNALWLTWLKTVK